MSTESITIIAVGATILLVIVGLATLFYTMFSGRLDRLSGRLDRLSDRLDKLSDRVDQLSDRVNQLSNEVSQIKAILDNAGFVVKESEVSYKRDQGAAGSKKSA